MGASRGILQTIFGGRSRTPATTPRAVIHAWLTRARAAQSGEGGLQRRRRQRWRWSYVLIARVGNSEFEVVAADVSSVGIGLLSPQTVDADARVWLRDLRGSDWVAARVRHAQVADACGIYRIGLEFELDADPAEGPPPARP